MQIKKRDRTKQMKLIISLRRKLRAMKKKVIKNQQYEDYWKITLEYSDILGEPFNKVLSIFIEFIDKYVDINEGMTSNQYQDLQKIVESVYPKTDSASTRKKY